MTILPDKADLLLASGSVLVGFFAAYAYGHYKGYKVGIFARDTKHWAENLSISMWTDHESTQSKIWLSLTSAGVTRQSWIDSLRKVLLEAVKNMSDISRSGGESMEEILTSTEAHIKDGIITMARNTWQVEDPVIRSFQEWIDSIMEAKIRPGLKDKQAMFEKMSKRDKNILQSTLCVDAKPCRSNDINDDKVK